MKRILLLVAGVAAGVIIGRATTKVDTVYTTVKGLDYTSDVVTVQDISGTYYRFAGVEDWELRDGCSITLKNGEIISVKYER